MVVLSQITQLKRLNEPLVITVGKFDGVHLGHQLVLKKLNLVAQQQKAKSVLISFTPHPRQYFNPNDAFQYIQTRNEQQKSLAECGVDIWVEEKFGLDFANQTAEAFFRLLKEQGLKHLIMGYDQQFGKDKVSQPKEIIALSQKLHFEISRTTHLLNHETKIGSTQIKKMLDQGEIETANQNLGYPFSMTGTVVLGKSIGRTIGFPTANLAIDPAKIIPANGVYIAEVTWRKKTFWGLLNIGHRPTIDKKLKQTLEVHLLKFKEDLYGETLTVAMLKKIRNEQKFASLEELKTQITLDIQRAIAYFEAV